jgi:hypothetical protein
MTKITSQAQLESGDKISLMCFQCFTTFSDYRFPFKFSTHVRYEFSVRCKHCRQIIEASLQGVSPTETTRLGLIES